MTDFFDSPAGQFALIAKQFMQGALTLNEEQRVQGRNLFLPTLSLAGHGLEMMLKACLFLNGKTPPTSGWQGHNVVSLWKDDVCEPVRGHVFANAVQVATEARLGDVYRDISDGIDTVETINKYIIELGNLHGGRSYPLRYPSCEGQEAPRTPFLVKSLHRTADDLVKRPSDFELDRFRGVISLR